MISQWVCALDVSKLRTGMLSGSSFCFRPGL